MLFIEDSAPVIVQGMTGHQGMTHTARMLKAGTNIVARTRARPAHPSPSPVQERCRRGHPRVRHLRRST